MGKMLSSASAFRPAGCQITRQYHFRCPFKCLPLPNDASSIAPLISTSWELEARHKAAKSSLVTVALRSSTQSQLLSICSNEYRRVLCARDGF